MHPNTTGVVFTGGTIYKLIFGWLESCHSIVSFDSLNKIIITLWGELKIVF